MKLKTISTMWYHLYYRIIFVLVNMEIRFSIPSRSIALTCRAYCANLKVIILPSLYYASRAVRVTLSMTPWDDLMQIMVVFIEKLFFCSWIPGTNYQDLPDRRMTRHTVHMEMVQSDSLSGCLARDSSMLPRCKLLYQVDSITVISPGGFPT